MARAWRTCRDVCRDSKLAVSFEVSGRENVPAIPGACTTRNISYQVKNFECLFVVDWSARRWIWTLATCGSLIERTKSCSWIFRFLEGVLFLQMGWPPVFFYYWNHFRGRQLTSHNVFLHAFPSTYYQRWKFLWLWIRFPRDQVGTYLSTHFTSVEPCGRFLVNIIAPISWKAEPTRLANRV